MSRRIRPLFAAAGRLSAGQPSPSAARIRPVTPAAADHLEPRLMLAGAEAVDDMIGPLSDDVDSQFTLADLTDNDTNVADARLDGFTQPSAGTLGYDTESQTFTYSPGDAGPGDVTFTYTLACDTETTSQTLAPATATADAEYGFASAFEGGTLVVSAPGENAVYVFTQDGDGAFGEPVRLTASTAGSERFGQSVAVSGDRIVVGDPDAGVGGRAVVFEADGAGGYSEAAVLTADDTTAGDDFGAAVAVSGDRIAIGAPFEDSPNGGGGGAVYVFTPGGDDFTLTQKIEDPFGTGDSGEDSVSFGSALALEGDRLVVGAPDGSTGGTLNGLAFVYDADAAGQFTLSDMLSGGSGSESFIQFGFSVAVEGDAVLVGATEGTAGGQVAAGTASLFERGTDGTYSLVQQIESDSPDTGNMFGRAVALSGDLIAVGSPLTSEGGRVSLFRRDADSVTLVGRFDSDTTGRRLGNSLAIIGDSVFAGAPRADVDGSTDAGTGLLISGIGDTGVETDTATVTLTLAEVNDPVTLEDVSVVVSPNAMDGDTVVDLDASDPDGEETLTYSITAGNDAGAFAIDASTGEITVADAAAVPAMSMLTVSVTDGEFSDTATVTITQQNSAPVLEDAEADVPDDAEAGDPVIDLEATDADGDMLTYAITAGDEGGVFAINSETGEITVADPAGLTGTFTLTVQVSDDADPVNTTEATVTLTVVSTNEPPVLDDASADVSPTAEAGDVVINLMATDPENGALTYAITSGNEEGAFAIDAGTGEITVAVPSALPREVVLEVTVSDDGDPVASDTATITITRTNRAPVIEDAEATVRSDAEAGELVFDFEASDDDSDDTLTFEITDGNTGGAFAINASTGEITVADPDALTGDFTLTVQVSDDRDPAATDTATLSVTVLPPNNAPVLDDASAEVPRDAMSGDVVLTLSATDADDGDTLTYTITGGNESGAFALDPDTGEITVADASNVPDVTMLEVTVTDGEDSDTATITLTREEAQNTAPTLADQTVTVARDAADGTVVVDLEAEDAEGDTLTYEIIAGNESGAFAIDAMTGVVTVADADAVPETASLNIRVTDDGDPRGVTSATLTINRGVEQVAARDGLLYVDSQNRLIRVSGEDGSTQVLGRIDGGSGDDASLVFDQILFGDFSGDGITDVVGVTDAGDVLVSVVDGDTITTSDWGSFDVGASDYQTFRVGDFDGDQIDDIAARDVTSGYWTVAFSDGQGTLTNDTRWARWTPTRDWLGVTVGDFDADGADDISGRADVASRPGNGGGVYVSSLQPATSSGNTTALTRNVTTWSPDLVWGDEAALDVDGDGDDDLLGRRTDTNGLYVGVSNGDLEGPGRLMQTRRFGIIGVGRPLSDVVVGDFTGDGLADVAVRFENTGTVWTGQSTGAAFTFSRWGRVQGDDLTDAVVADLTDDGLDDLLLREESTGDATLLVSDGGTFTPSPLAGLIDDDADVRAQSSADVPDETADA